jgi:DNA-binding GntR family transcriptional regulator
MAKKAFLALVPADAAVAGHTDTHAKTSTNTPAAAGGAPPTRRPTRPARADHAHDTAEAHQRTTELPQPSSRDDDTDLADIPRTLIEQTYARLRDDIIEGRLAPDEKLRVQHLRQRYGASAGTLREAITRLASDALVVAEGQRGFRVAPVALQDLIDLTELRVHIEIDALRQSIRKGDEAWRASVREVFAELSAHESPINPAKRHVWERLNTRFHETLIGAHASPWTLKLLRMLARHGERYRRYAMRLTGSARDVHAEHAEIVEATLAGKEARAALALEAHIRATTELLVKAEGEGVRWC